MAPTTTQPDDGLPETGVSAVLETGYLFGTVQGAAADEDLPFALGSITARWYTEAGRYVVIYDGLDLDAVKTVVPWKLGVDGERFLSS